MTPFHKRVFSRVIAVAIIAASTANAFVQGHQHTQHKPDVPFVISVDEVVDAMLKTAGVTEKDVVYDLGCGDGRIVIAAAQKYGARGVGIDINPKLIRQSKRNARQAGVSQKVSFISQDFFKTN